MYKTKEGKLGIRIESFVEVDEEGQPQSNQHHIIEHIHPQVCHVISILSIT